MAHINPAEKAPWTAEGQEKRAAVKTMFAEIAPTYDLCNSLMTFTLHKRWRAWAAKQLQLKPGDRALDACSGTGDFIPQLRKHVGPKGVVMAADFCLPMLQRAKDKAANALFLADTQRLPMRNELFDGVTVGWGIRNVPDADEAHIELTRILKRGGRFVSLDMARPKNRFMRKTSEWVFNHMVPFLGTMFGKRKAYTYLPKSTATFKTREELKMSMERAGLVDVQYRDLFFGNICVHWGRKG